MHPASRPIRQLSDHLINQIAAGEVIERPASVVKELVENSIDAGATRIAVDVELGGIDRITVSDDGRGLHGPELAAALRRHWTSKIALPSDLDALASLGFRGEALASISAVADVEIIARTVDDAHAWRLAVAAGELPGSPQPATGNRGCRVEVRRLFHKVPARKRFLKQPRTEFLHIQRLLKQLAFARPDVALTLTQRGGRDLRLRAASTWEAAPRWRVLFGQAFSERAHHVDIEMDGVAVKGWIGGPELAGTQSELQFLALNGRTIRDRHLQHAIRAAFDERIPAGLFPAYALALRTGLDAVDVNVHPGKLEVRFADLRKVHDIVYAAVRRVVTDRDGIPAPMPSSSVYEQRPQYAASPTAPRSRTVPPAPATLGRRLAVVEGSYLLLAREDGVWVLDLIAAWYAVVRRRLDQGAGDSRPLLLPVRLPPALSVTSCTALAAMGFAFDDLGPAGRLLRAVPTVLPHLDHEEFIHTLTAALAAGAGGPAEAVARAAATSAGKAHAALGSSAVEDELGRAAAAAGYDLGVNLRPLTADDLRRVGGAAR